MDEYFYNRGFRSIYICFILHESHIILLKVALFSLFSYLVGLVIPDYFKFSAYYTYIVTHASLWKIFEQKTTIQNSNDVDDDSTFILCLLRARPYSKCFHITGQLNLCCVVNAFITIPIMDLRNRESQVLILSSS